LVFTGEAGQLFDHELRSVALSLPSSLDAAATVEQQRVQARGILDDRILIEIWDKAQYC
jgi:two-component system OmpR family sensor kinase